MLPTVSIYNHGEKLALKLSSFSTTVIKLIKGIPSSHFDGTSGAWLVDAMYGPDVMAALHSVPHKLTPGTALSVRRNVEYMDPVGNVRPLTPGEAVDWDSIEYSPKTKSYAHQMRATVLGYRRLRFAFLMEMGTGKTKACLDTIFALMQNKGFGGAIIIAPKSVIYNWPNEIAMHCPLPDDQQRCVVVSGKDKGDQLEYAYNARANFVITNYETMLKYEGLVLQILMDRPMAMALDESTKIKNHASLATKAIQRVKVKAVARFILTGTPITQGPMDAFSQFLFLDEDILGHHNFYSFKAEYAISGGFRGREIVGYRNLDRLSKKIEPWSYRVLKKDCLDLPEKVYRVVELEMSATQQNLYDQMRRESILEYQGMVLSAPLALTRLLRLQQITSGFIPVIDEFGKQQGFKNLDGPKLAACLELVEEAIANGQKIIIWCRFIEELMAVAAAVPPGAVAYYGAVSAADRQAAVDAFQNDEKVKIFIGQIQTGGMGITLTAATCVIYMSNTFTLSERLQSEDRPHRIGQRNVVTYIDLTCKATVDGFVIKTLRDKKDIADVITGDNFRKLLEAA